MKFLLPLITIFSISEGLLARARAPLTAAQIKELKSFYQSEEFPSNLTSEIHSHVMLSDAAITTAELKTIFPDSCDMVIDQIATVVHTEVSDVLLEGAKDIKKTCPQWNNLTVGDRKDFYVALITSMALAESTCNNKARNRGAPNGTAYGLWQSPKQLSPAAGARWTLQKLESQVADSGLLFWPNSHKNYWSVLNPNLQANKVKKILKKIPACAVRGMIPKANTNWERFD